MIVVVEVVVVFEVLVVLVAVVVIALVSRILRVVEWKWMNNRVIKVNFKLKFG